jgi:hypothetical protein
VSFFTRSLITFPSVTPCAHAAPLIAKIAAAAAPSHFDRLLLMRFSSINGGVDNAPPDAHNRVVLRLRRQPAPIKVAR